MKHSVYKYFRICVLGGLFLLTQGIPAFADTHAQDFLDGIKQYDAREYGKAAALFEKLAASGIHNGKLYYNLANAYLKQGKLGKAILWYERAQRLIPGDPDLAFNMNFSAVHGNHVFFKVGKCRQLIDNMLINPYLAT